MCVMCPDMTGFVRLARYVGMAGAQKVGALDKSDIPPETRHTGRGRTKGYKHGHMGSYGYVPVQKHDAWIFPDESAQSAFPGTIRPHRHGTSGGLTWDEPAQFT